jgi:hypothetical protein
MMIDVNAFLEIPKIVDRVIQLLNVRAENRRKAFENFVAPLFRDLTTVHENYVSVMWDLTHGLTSREKDPLVVRKEIETRRRELAHVRQKLRDLAAELTKDTPKTAKLPDECRAFAKAVLHYFGVAAGEGDYRGSIRYASWFGTLLEMLNNTEKDSFNPKHIIYECLSAVEERWSDVTMAYARARLACLV